jgi:hypothetical protein
MLEIKAEIILLATGAASEPLQRIFLRCRLYLVYWQSLFQIIANMPVQQQWQRQKTYLALIIAPICSPASVFIFELF